MAFRNLVIESPAHLSVRNDQLLIRTGAEHSVPMEDISAVLLENRQNTITTAALSRLGQRGCAVFFCDERHLPCSVLLPYQQHSRSLSVLKSQLNATAPAKKRLWQAVVKQKIRNQGKCLELSGMKKAAEHLYALAARVSSGDTGNAEATAARYYFSALFGDDFFRGDDNGINAGLNYGYAILRGCIARSLAVYGFQPALGIHHRSELNAFNLADDLIEPFRPIVDLLVLHSVDPSDELTPEHKRLLFNCLNLDVLLGGQHHSVSYAIERTVQSLSAALSEKNAALILPELLPTKQHRYE